MAKSAERIVGHLARMKGEVEVEAWMPPTRKEVDGMPGVPARAPRGWAVEPAAGRDGGKDPLPPQAAPSAAEPQETPADAQQAPTMRPLPPEVAPDSVQALIWEQPRESAQLMRIILNEAPAEGTPDPKVRLAIICVTLGQEVSGELFKGLNDYEVEEIVQAIGNLKNVSQELAGELLEDFRQMLQASQWVSQGGVEFARQALERARGPQRAQEIISKVTQNTSQGFYMLNNVAPDQIAPFISHEHPQTIALILSQLEPAKAAGILSLLSERLQADVSYRISTMENVTPAVLRQIEESLEASLRDLLGGDADVGGPKVLADILNNLSISAVEKNVLDQFDAQDHAEAERVRNLMFVFEDIERMSDHDIQVLLRATDGKDLAIALKAAPEGLKDKIKSNMSDEGWQQLAEEMEFIGPMRLSEVEEVQLKVVQGVRQLEEQGQITIVRGGGDDQFV